MIPGPEPGRRCCLDRNIAPAAVAGIEFRGRWSRWQGPGNGTSKMTVADGDITEDLRSSVE